MTLLKQPDVVRVSQAAARLREATAAYERCKTAVEQAQNDLKTANSRLDQAEMKFTRVSAEEFGVEVGRLRP